MKRQPSDCRISQSVNDYPIIVLPRPLPQRLIHVAAPLSGCDHVHIVPTRSLQLSQATHLGFHTTNSWGIDICYVNNPHCTSVCQRHRKGPKRSNTRGNPRTFTRPCEGSSAAAH